MANTYNIYQNGVKVKEGIATLTETITDLTPETEYTFIVTAVDEEGNESPKTASVKVTTLADEVQGFSLPEVTIKASQKTMSISAGATRSLDFDVTPEDVPVSFTNSNPEVATYTNGVIAALEKGTTTITATVDETGATATCVITVK